MKWNKQFEYPASMRTSIEGRRHYEITGKKLPSVTTILAATQSEEKMAPLANCQQRVGDVEEERLKTTAASRGQNMPINWERDIIEAGNKDLTDEVQEC